MDHSRIRVMRENTIPFLIVLLIAGIAVYFNSFFNGFIWDDQTIIVLNEYIRGWSNLPAIFTTDLHQFSLEQSNFYRPLQVLSYTLDHSFWKLKPMGYHITNVLWHILNAMLVYFLFNAAGKRSAGEKTETKWPAFLTALIWLVHPLHTQCATYASGRADLLVTAFILSTLLSHMAGNVVWTAGFFVLALLSKEYALITPLLLLMVDSFLYIQRAQWTLGRMLKRYGALLIVLAVYIILRLTVLSFPSSSDDIIYPHLGFRILTSAKAIGILIGFLAVPLKLSFLRNIDWVAPEADGAAYLCLAAVLGLIAFSFVIRKKNPLAAFGLFWFFLAYMPYMNIIPLNANVSEHWMYLSSIGLIFALVSAVGTEIRSGRGRQVAVYLAALLVVFYGARLVRRNFDFRDEIVFYEKEIKENPDNARVHYNLGTAYVKQGNYEKGIPLLERTVALDPKYAGAYGNLGQTYYELGQLDKAIEYYEKADALSDALVENPVNLARAYAQTGQYDKAVPLLEKALKLRPNHVGALNDLGVEYGRRGEYDRAEELFRRVLQIEPNNIAAQRNLALIEELRQR